MYRGGNMIYAFIILIFIGVALNKLSQKYIFEKLVFKRTLSKNVVEIDEDIEVSTILENKKILPVSFLHVIEYYPSATKYKTSQNVTKNIEHIEHKTTMFLLPFQRKTRKLSVSFNKRGKYIFNNVWLAGGDLLGKDTYSRQLYYQNDITVLPRSLPLEEAMVPYGDFMGDVSVRRWIMEDPVINIGIREYTGFEPQRHIHWPSSLKYNKIMVKQYDHTTDYKVMLIVNIECSKPFWSNIDASKIETCLSLTRGIMDELESKGIPYGFTSNCIKVGSNKSITIPYGCGTSHYYNIVKILGESDYAITTQFEEILHGILNSNHLSTTYVIITPSLLDSYVNLINKLGEKCGKVFLYSLKDYNLDKLNNIISYTEKER